MLIRKTKAGWRASCCVLTALSAWCLCGGTGESTLQLYLTEKGELNT